MKRWLAGLLAAVVLLSGGTVCAENNPTHESADIPEPVAAPEEEETGTLAENIRFLSDTLQNEDVRGLLRRKDVQLIFNDVILEVLIWMAENRPVTMKILDEMGVSQQDCGIIEKIWDSVDRILEEAEAYGKTEDGKLLQQEFAAVRDDPDIKEAFESLFRIFSSDDFIQMLQDLQSTGETGTNNAENQEDHEGAPEQTDRQDGLMMQQAREMQLDGTTFSGKILFAIFRCLDENDWVLNNLPKLLLSENLWKLMIHLANMESSVVAVAQNEFDQLMSDPETAAFFRRTVEELFAARDHIFELLGEISNDGQQDDTKLKEEPAL